MLEIDGKPCSRTVTHGIEIRLDSEEDAVRLDDVELERVGVLEEVLKGIARGIDNVWIEDKPAGFALHTRLATERHSRVAHVVALSEARAEVQGVTVRKGKNVLEFSVRSTTKGEAVQHLRRYTGAIAVLCAGDVGIKSGEGTTAAAYRVRGPEQVAHALRLLADLRSV